MAYAVRDDVLARAGRYGGVFSVPGKRPNEADLDVFLDEVASLIDTEIRRRGYDPALLTADSLAVLTDVNAWAVVIRALPQALPGDEDAQELIDRGIEIVKAAGFPSLADGGVDVFGLLEALDAGAAGGGPGSSAGSFWDDVVEPEETWDEDEIGEAAQPLWRRGQSL